MFRTKKWGCPLCHLGGQLLPADPEPWAACLHVRGVLLPPGDIHILVHLPLFYAVFCWFSVLVMWFFYCFVPSCTRCSLTIGSIRQRWAAQHASGASECYAEEWPSTPRVWHFLHLYFFFFFFFLKRNVSHLGFIFVFSEDYFLFSPFSFFWEDRLFTVDYRQKCCSPSYETAFFFSLKRRCCCTFSARSPFLSKQILPQHSSLRWLMPANGEGPVLPTSAGDLRCWPR